MKHKTLIVLLTAVLSVAFCTTARAEEIKVGVSPDPYSPVWYVCDDEDYEYLRRVVYWESGECACTEETNIAIIETVLNRCINDEWGNDIYSVIRQYGQFYCKNAPHDKDEEIYRQIEYVKMNGKTVLPSYEYCYFASAMQSLGTDHIWIGKRKSNGKPDKGKNYCHGMYFCREDK